MERSAQPTSPWRFFIGGIVMILLVLIVAKLALKWLPAAPDEDAARDAERAKALQDLQAEDRQKLETYAWVDRAKGQVQIPIGQAVELTLKDLNRNQPRAAGPIATPAPAAPEASPTPAAP